MSFSFRIYTQLTEQDLRIWHEIGRPGTISTDGTNRDGIGGIDRKVVAASKEGATIFLCTGRCNKSSVKKKISIDTNQTIKEPLKLAKKKLRHGY